MEKLILPMIHLNGTGIGTLEKNYWNALVSVDKAIDDMIAIEFNARDYYPISDTAYLDAKKQRTEQLKKLYSVKEYFEEHLKHLLQTKDA